MPLDERKQKVLQAVVDEHVATADPVSSRSIVSVAVRRRSGDLRNEMAELEDRICEQPHTRRVLPMPAIAFILIG